MIDVLHYKKREERWWSIQIEMMKRYPGIAWARSLGWSSRAGVWYHTSFLQWKLNKNINKNINKNWRIGTPPTLPKKKREAKRKSFISVSVFVFYSLSLSLSLPSSLFPLPSRDSHTPFPFLVVILILSLLLILPASSNILDSGDPI